MKLLPLAAFTIILATNYLFAWEKIEPPIATPWFDEVTPENAHAEYPRPQMQRQQWQSLNGLWDFAIMGKGGPWEGGRIENAKVDLLLAKEKLPANYDHEILVPFSPETALSGIGKEIRPDQYLAYRRTFTVSEHWKNRQVLLNFEAVDWHAIIYVNGKRVSQHRGGYTPFSFNITKYLTWEKEVIEVYAWDPTNFGDQAVGKQALSENRVGFRYTPNSGIYGSVWLEPVAQSGLRRLMVTPRLMEKRVNLQLGLVGKKLPGLRMQVQVKEGDQVVAQYDGAFKQSLSLKFNKRILRWSPDNPYLYDLKIRLFDGNDLIDTVDSYVGMRRINVRKGPVGAKQIFLNGKTIFQFGPLDQGYWPESALTPPSDAAMVYDLQYLKDIGCNFVRVHIKTHPRRWYYHADRLGLLVWQDLVCSRKFDSKITDESAAQWEKEQWRMLDALHNHPSIIMWIVFNEGWGQYDTVRLTQETKKRDPSRLVTGASGWTDHEVGDIYDMHDYSYYPSFGDGASVPTRASLLGECGGHNLYIDGHLWPSAEKKPLGLTGISEKGRENWLTIKQMDDRYEQYIQQLALLREKGMNGAVYTQITDVEHECNGWLTYDRKVSKIPVERLREIHQVLYQEQPIGKALVDSSKLPDWKPLHDDEESKLTKAAFSFNLDQVPDEPLAVRLSGHGKFKILINDELACELVGTAHASADTETPVPLTAAILPDDSLRLLKKGTNSIRIEITRTTTKRTFKLDAKKLVGEVQLGSFELLQL